MPERAGSLGKREKGVARAPLSRKATFELRFTLENPNATTRCGGAGEFPPGQRLQKNEAETLFVVQLEQPFPANEPSLGQQQWTVSARLEGSL